VCGWISSRLRPFASLILGIYKDGSLFHVGQVGTGFDRKDEEEIYQILSKNEIEKPPFRYRDPLRRNMHWVHPDLVIRVSAMEWTEKGRLRSPVFIRLRNDKLPEECQLED